MPPKKKGNGARGKTNTGNNSNNSSNGGGGNSRPQLKGSTFIDTELKSTDTASEITLKVKNNPEKGEGYFAQAFAKICSKGGPNRAKIVAVVKALEPHASANGWKPSDAGTGTADLLTATLISAIASNSGSGNPGQNALAQLLSSSTSGNSAVSLSSSDLVLGTGGASSTTDSKLKLGTVAKAYATKLITFTELQTICTTSGLDLTTVMATATNLARLASTPSRGTPSSAKKQRLTWSKTPGSVLDVSMTPGSSFQSLFGSQYGYASDESARPTTPAPAI